MERICICKKLVSGFLDGAHHLHHRLSSKNILSQSTCVSFFTMDAQLKLIAERGVVKTTLTKIKTYINEVMKSMPITNIQNHLEFHQLLIERFVKLQDQIKIAVTVMIWRYHRATKKIILQTSILV